MNVCDRRRGMIVGTIFFGGSQKIKLKNEIIEINFNCIQKQKQK